MTVQDYDKIIRERLKTPRYQHSVNVAGSAVQLAKQYGADVQKAEIAGILHDVTKEADQAEHFTIIKEGGLTLTPLEQDSPKLWHAVSGSAFVRTQLDIIDPEIVDAIRYHTTGREGMTLLDKVIFIADFISADRDYDGVDKMREIAARDLDEAVLEGLAYTIYDLSERKITIAPDTFFAYNELAFAKAQKT